MICDYYYYKLFAGYLFKGITVIEDKNICEKTGLSINMAEKKRG